MVHVPPAYLHRKLYTADKKALQAALDIKNDKGNSYPWKHVLPLMETSSYTIQTGRDPCTYMIIENGLSLGIRHLRCLISALRAGERATIIYKILGILYRDPHFSARTISSAEPTRPKGAAGFKR